MYGLDFGDNGHLYAGAELTGGISISVISRFTGATLFPGTEYNTNAGLYGMTSRIIPR